MFWKTKKITFLAASKIMNPTLRLRKSKKDKKTERKEYSEDSDSDYGCWEIKPGDFNC